MKKKSNFKLIHLKSGFTIIELLIVLAIVATLISLVGPLALNSIDKYQSKVEVTELKSLLFRFSQLSFLKGQNLTLSFNNNSVVSESPDGSEQRFIFTKIQFYSNDVIFNSSGIPDVAEVRFIIADKEQRLDVFEVIYDK